jgi:predicted MFS family arabinose efflux permease
VNPSAGEPRLLTGPAGRVVGLLGAVQALAYLDRSVVAAVVEDLRADLWLTDTRLGALLTALVLVQVLASLALGGVAERRSRPRLLGAGLALWGAAAMASGLARSFAALLAARVAAGAGAGAHAAVSPGLAADHLAPARRGRGRALFLAAVPIGCAVGYVAGGLLDGALGWRAALLAAGAPVLVAALLCLRLGDAPRGAGEHPLAGGARGLAAAARRLLAHRPYALAVAGRAAWAFALAGVAFWMPAFLARARGVPRAVAAVQLGAVVLMTAFAGTFAGGLLADALRRRMVRAAELWVAGGAAAAAAPLAVAALTAHRPAVYLVALVAALLLLFASGAAARAAAAGAAPPADRAGAAAISVLAVQLLGEAPAPMILGMLSDLSSLDRAVLIVPAAALAAGAIWAWAAWRGERGARARDQERARSAAS